MKPNSPLSSNKDLLRTASEVAGYHVKRLRRGARLAFHRVRGRQVIHFLHVSKTGGSAVKYSLKKHRLSDNRYLQFHPHGVDLSDIPVGEKVIFFLRDPLSRFVSSFYSRKRQGRPRYFTPWKTAEKKAFARFSTPNELGLALSASDKRRRKNAKEAMHAILHVKRSYWHWLVDRDYFLSRLTDIFFWGRQENLETDFRLLCERLRLPQGIQLPRDDIMAHRSPDDLDRRLEPRARVNLEQWYAADYGILRLCRQHLGHLRQP